ncbi:MAG: hypothetical protein ACI8UR_000913 [Natronomonas sp.]|uniref:hypothetical protein n=1 Tax=Natronomonas sp. TaxID=2184060 RepID=UPI0039899BC1
MSVTSGGGVNVGRQPRSNGFSTGRPGQPDGLHLLDPSELSRYDFVLALIPFVLMLAWVVGQVSSVPQWAAMAVGALTALPLLADGLAVNPPA